MNAAGPRARKKWARYESWVVKVAQPSAPSVSLVPVSSVHRNEIVISVDLELELAHALLEALDLTEQRRLVSR